MVAVHTSAASRTLRLTNIPGYDGELLIEIKQKGDSNVGTGIALDHVIIPRILKALNDLEDHA